MPPLVGRQMTEHLDGSYPTSKFSEIIKPWVMDRKMLMPVILSFDIFITGVGSCSLYGLVSEKPGSDNGDLAHAFFLFYLFYVRFINE